MRRNRASDNYSRLRRDDQKLDEPAPRDNRHDGFVEVGRVIDSGNPCWVWRAGVGERTEGDEYEKKTEATYTVDIVKDATQRHEDPRVLARIVEHTGEDE